MAQDGTVQDYKNAGCGGPTMYRHNESANLAFYDGHVEARRKEKVFIEEDFTERPYEPRMWVVNRKIWEANGGGK